MIDLREALLLTKGRETIYHKTDSHWNDAGAFAADTAIVAWLKQGFPLLQPLAREDFLHRMIDLSGDISQLADLEDRLKESAPCLIPLRDHPARTQNGQRLLSANFPPNHPAPVIEGGNDVVVTECPTAPDLRVVVFHDSFGRALMPFLAQHFRHTTFVRKFFDASMVASLRPHIVINVVVERHLELAFDVVPLPHLPRP